MSAPLVVNLTDGTVWTRRGSLRGGEALYAPAGVCSCPEFVMATLAELAEHGIAGSADVLPVPVGSEPQAPMSSKAARVRLAQYGERTKTWSTATYNDGTERALYEIALTLLAEADGLRTERAVSEQRSERRRIAWRMAYQRAQARGWAADRYAARARDAQDALQHMLFAIIAGQLALHEANRERQELRARVAELEAAQERPAAEATPAQIDAHLRSFLSEAAYLRFQQTIGEHAIGQTVEDAGAVRAAADNEGLHNADWREGWDDAIERVAPDQNAAYPVELVAFASEPGVCPKCGDGSGDWCVGCSACRCQPHLKGCMYAAGGAS